MKSSGVSVYPKDRKSKCCDIAVFGFILLSTLALAIPAVTNAAQTAHIPSISSKQHGYHAGDTAIVPKKGKDKLLPEGHGSGQHGGYIPPSAPAPVPDPQPHPVPLPSPVDDSFGIGDPRHPYNPNYNPDDHFAHYPDYRMMNDHLGELDKIENPHPQPGNEHGDRDRERGLKPTRPPRPQKSTVGLVHPIEDDHGNKDSPDGVTTTKTTTQRTTTSTRPDWDYVCYVLCQSNMGGIACRCDILPIG